MSILTDNIQRRLGQLNMSQEMLAKLIGYKGRSSINRIINGDADVPYSKIEDIARALKTTPALLCGWDAEESNLDDGRNGYNLHILKNRLIRRGYHVEIFSNYEEANFYIIERCKGKSVGLAPSLLIDKIGLETSLKENNFENFYCCNAQKSREARKKAMTSDVFILSASGISYQSGEMVAISGGGVRIAGSLYYSDEVIFIIGRSKISRTLDEAIDNARNIYRVNLAKQKGAKLPCVATSKCENCMTADSLCKFTCIYHRGDSLVNTTVILIDEGMDP